MSGEYFETGYVDEPEAPEACTCDPFMRGINQLCPICKAEYDAWCEDLYRLGIIGDFSEEAEQRRLAA